jgi:hypothetical protein
MILVRTESQEAAHEWRDRRARPLPHMETPCDVLRVFDVQTIEQWLLFEYVGLEFTPLSKPFKTREQTEKAREKYSERLRKGIGLGVVRIRK